MANPLLIFFLFTLSLAPPYSAAAPPPPAAACKSTPHRELCLSILSASNSDNYAKFSVKQCLQHSRKLSDSIADFAAKQELLMSYSETAALDDCRQLQELSAAYLELIAVELKSAAANLSEALACRLQTLLSAVVTNHQTCYDGLVEVGSALAAPLGDAAAVYSVSLGLVTHAFSRKGPRPSGAVAAELDWARYPTSDLFETIHLGKKGRIVEELWEQGIHVNATVTVSPYGGANFTSINDAVASAPNNSAVEDGYFVIYAKQGYYQEYVVVPRHKKNIMLVGDGINATVITGNRSVVDGWTTFNSATFIVYGERFVAMGISFENTAGPEKHQAVAVRNSADISSFYRCSIAGYQDTLYAHSMRQFYRECDISGTVDFIFGNAAAVFQSCNLYGRAGLPNQKVAFTAQGRSDPNQNTGISIQNCTVTAAAAPSPAESYLGRPWKQYSRTVYMESYIGELINPVGWLEWNGTAGLDTLYYGEYRNYGPRADTAMRVKWPGYTVMNATEALDFTVFNFTMGETWLPSTNIPFHGGLVVSP
ncbi:pectinesterase-like [Salvia miltiorrhiza]|uniref:pectinesterase-like n=1 Tax=Salvia miltiorrhiza TaxID=226208 RepID=UPI0025ABFB30|nr:pectinesterase-like [Salvia miltiorrhiza]